VRPLATTAAPPGEVLAAGEELRVACGEEALALLELQRPGGRRMTAAEFLRGRKPAPGARFELPPPGAPAATA
jgi:methionyl-tRNA formyltransferase